MDKDRAVEEFRAAHTRLLFAERVRNRASQQRALAAVLAKDAGASWTELAKAIGVTRPSAIEIAHKGRRAS